MNEQRNKLRTHNPRPADRCPSLLDALRAVLPLAEAGEAEIAQSSSHARRLRAILQDARDAIAKATGTKNEGPSGD